MVSRRKLLLGGMAAATAATFRRSVDLQAAAASQPTTPLNFDMPAGATDCHTHIFEPRFPLDPNRTYTPPPATFEEMLSLHRGTHMDRVVCVHGLPYGADLSVTIDELAKLDKMGKKARAVAVIDGDTITDARLDELHKLGFRGVRHNLLQGGPPTVDYARKRLQMMDKRLAGRGWCIEASGGRLAMVDDLFDDYMAASSPLVFSHFAGAQVSAGLEQPGLQSVLKLLKAGKAYVKISAVYRGGKTPPDYADAGPLAQALVNANPDRAVYGSDWPHPLGVPPAGGTRFDLAPYVPLDDGRVVNNYAVWFPDPALRKKIFVDNPTRLYGF